MISRLTSSTTSKNPIFVFQSPETRALNLGYISNKSGKKEFVPARLSYGARRREHTYRATVQSLQLLEIKKILGKYQPKEISTMTLLRETLACRVGDALATVGIHEYFGDAFIGATHIKGDGAIRTDYKYENLEGLVSGGLWVIVESLCTGRNLSATLNQILPRFTPKELIIIAPIASLRAIETIDEIVSKYGVPIHYVAWGGLFGVDEVTLYDMPWGHTDTRPVDKRDQELFIQIYGPKLCMGGDFGNNYYGPSLAFNLYQEQLKEHNITPVIPSVKDILKSYKSIEFITETE